MRTQLLLIGGLALSVLLAVLIAPFASSDPDGLERVAEDHEFLEQAESQPPAWDAAPLPDYETPGVEGTLSTSAAGILGTVAAFGLALGLGYLLRKREASREEEETLT